jgi:uncharacterized membrane protein
MTTMKWSTIYIWTLARIISHAEKEVEILHSVERQWKSERREIAMTVCGHVG